MDAFTPQQTTELVSRIGTKKSHMRPEKLFANSLLTGPLLGFGCAVMVSTEAAPWYAENAPGLIRTVSAMFFPVGLIMIVLTGADLFTSNIMFMGTAFLHRRIGIVDLAINWVISFFGNLAGMLFFMALVTGYGGVFQVMGYRKALFDFATMKMLTPEWHQIFLKAIGANWLVCLAVFLSISSRELVSKVIAIWWPTFTFVALGLDHVIANMYFIPCAIFYDHPDIGVGLYIWKSLIPTLLGNLIGGGFFVATVYWYLYLTGLNGAQIKFDMGSLDTAMEAGGPMGPRKVRSNVMVDEGGVSSGSEDTKVLEGQEVASPKDGVMAVPSTDMGMNSAVGHELRADTYGRPKADVVSDGDEKV